MEVPIIIVNSIITVVSDKKRHYFCTDLLLYPVWSWWECTVDVVPGGMELEPWVKSGSLAGRSHL
jgi:hypothetical protein